MKTLRFTLVFEGVDLDDFDVLDQLAQVAPNVHWGEIDGEVQADVYTGTTSVCASVQATVDLVRQLAPEARAVRVDEHLVAISDIARRCHVNRETVRLWAKESGFPRPRGVVGKGIKVWDWAAVNTWLRDEHAGTLGDPYRRPTPLETAEANDLLHEVATQG